MTFSDWLLSRDIDQQHLEPDLERALREQFEAEQAPVEVLVVCDDELWACAVRVTP